MNLLNDDLRGRLLVASRTGAAVFGGYALTSALSAFLALTLPMPRHEAALTAMLLSFLWYALAVIWVFYTRSVNRAWAGMLIPTALLVLVCWLIRMGGGA